MLGLFILLGFLSCYCGWDSRFVVFWRKFGSFVPVVAMKDAIFVVEKLLE